MGMYNEVYASCPRCKTATTAQISQIVLGFGEFDLDRPSSLEQLTEEELRTLRERIKDEKFYCEGCHTEFTYAEKKAIEAGKPTDKQLLIKELFG